MITGPEAKLPWNLACELCLEPFDLQNHLPKSLSCCGKSLCRNCLQGILKKYFPQCPWCKDQINSEFEAFKTNLQLLNIIEQDSKWEKCPKHGENMKLVCLKDRHKLCGYCGLSSECKNHDLVSLTHLKQTSDECIKELQHSLMCVENEAGKYEEAISKNRGIFHGIISESFDKQIFELRKAKAKTLMKLNSAFHEKRNTVASNFGQHQKSLRDEVQSKIYQHSNFLKAKDPIALIREDMSDLKMRVKSFIGESQEVKNFEKNLSKLAPLLSQKSALEQKENLDKLIESVKNGMKHSVEQSLMRISYDDEEIQVRVSGLCLELHEGPFSNSGVLSCCADLDKKVKGVGFKLGTIKEIRSVIFSAQGLDLNEINLEAIGCILQKIPLISRVSLVLESTPKMPLERMYQLFSIVFRKPGNLDNIWISFPPNNELVMMFSILMSEFTLLRTLKVHFSPGEYSAEICEEFAQNFSSVAEGLEKLDLGFSHTNFPISALQKIFISMPKLEEFLLNACKMADFNDYTLNLLTRDMKKLMPKLRKFQLDISPTSVSNHFAQALKTRMNFILDFSIYVDADLGLSASPPVESMSRTLDLS